MTLRTRLTLLTFSVLLLTLLAFAGMAGLVMWRVELGSVSRQLEAQAQALLTVAQSRPAGYQGVANDILEEKGISASGRIYEAQALRWQGGAAGPDTLDAAFLREAAPKALRQSGEYLVASRRSGNLTVQVGRNTEPLERLLRLYVLSALLTLLGVSALACWLVALQVRRTLAPLEALAHQVQHLEGQPELPAQAEPGEVGALARALQHSLNELHAERERETLFLASASHELRTPVTAMLADVQHTLSRERPAEELQAALRRTERTASRLRLLTGNLMTLTRVQRLHERPQWPRLELLHLAGEAVDLLLPLAMQRGLDLWLDGQEVAVLGESSLLSSVLENLIGNALKFTPVGGEVKVYVGKNAAGNAEIVVQDTGPGFAPSMSETLLTEAFVRGQTDVEGFGLGLAVVAQVVEIHSGALYLSRAEGGGALVRVNLPALNDA